MASTPSTRPQKAILFATVLILPVTLAACSQKSAPVDGSSSSEGPSVSPSTSPGKPSHTVILSGSLTRIYAATSLTAFADQPEVANVIRGTVTATRALISQPGNVVETILSVDVSTQRETGGPKTVEVREQGGVVPVSAVRADFEDKLGRKLTAKELAEAVDYQFEGIKHAAVGDQVLIIVGKDGSSKLGNAFVSLARLELASSNPNARGVVEPTYVWPGESPNPAWAGSVDAGTLLQ